MIKLVKQKMFEMALEKARYQDRLFSLIPQVIQNWCLCTYCKEYDPENENYRGWRKELVASLGNLNSIMVKGDKYKWTYDEIIKNDEFNNIEVIRRVCEYKLDDEDEIKPLQTAKVREKLYQSFADKAEFIVSILSGKDFVKPLIESLFVLPKDKH